MAKQEILLESGTNEVEIAEVILCGQSFGVNVAKIREFIPFEGLTVSRFPGRHPSVQGVFILRGKSIPLIRLEDHLNLQCGERSKQPVVVITEFNHMTTAFVADHIDRIHRVSWTEFKPLSTVLAGDSPYVVGTITLGEQEVLILDLEHIIGEIFPSSVINYDESAIQKEALAPTRQQAHLIFAEDSAIIRYQVSKILKEVGYIDLAMFDNGASALEEVERRRDQAREEGKELQELLTLVLTDIEMPKMDGLTLCRRIKKDLRLEVPVVMFSSLINEQMARKCESVGADAFTAKPETTRLIELLDQFCLQGDAPAS